MPVKRMTKEKRLLLHMFRCNSNWAVVDMSECDIYEKTETYAEWKALLVAVFERFYRAEISRRTTESRGVARNRPL